MEDLKNKKFDITLLYVEDEPDIRESVSEMLKRRVKTLHVATNGQEGYDLYSEHDPDIIITDIKMPVMNGLEMARKIKLINKNTQIIVTSAHSDIEFFIQSIEIGINHYILKPINREKLFETLDKTTNFVKLENQIKVQNEYIHKLFHAIVQSPSSVVITDLNGIIEFVNPRFCEMTGYSEAETIGSKFYLMVPDRKFSQEQREIIKTINNGKEWRGELLSTRKNGETYWEFASISPVKNTFNEVASYIKVAVDISDIKQAEDNLKQSEYKYRSLVENLGEGIAIVDFEENFIFANPALNKIFGIEENSIIGKNLKDFVSMQQFEQVKKQTALRKQNEQSIYELEIIQPSGNKRTLVITATPQHDSNNLPLATLGIFQDITERKQLMDELKISEAKYRSLAQNLGEGIAITDFNETFIYANPAAEKIFGVEPNGLIGKNIREFCSEKEFTRIISETQKRKKGEKSVYEIEIIRKNNENRTIVITATPQYNNEGEVIETHGIFLDVTEKNILMQELRTAKENAEKAYEIIESKNKNITDSIEYAKGIQQAIFPSEDMMEIFFPESFILYITKDIVSGDFPWISFKDNINYVAAVDCTGHGVPGAFMSIMGTTLLNQAINEHNLVTPADILEDINKSIHKMIQNAPGSVFSDGMDIALVSIDYSTKKIQFAGAFRPLFLYRNGELEQINGDVCPIGYYHHQGIAKFTNNVIDFNFGDTIYIFSDGYVHQFGGPKGKKFMLKQFKENLTNVQHMDMMQQKEVLCSQWHQWKGNYEQVDDVLIIGIRL